MKAVLMTTAGGPEVLQFREVPDPEFHGAFDVLVRVKAAGVNPVDTKVRRNPTYYPENLPAILGCDGAGIVEAVGHSVTRFKPGDAVYYFNNGLGGAPGNYAQYAVVHEDFLAPKPGNLSMVEAAALPLVVITAWEALVDRAKLDVGHSVLIHAGAGGVGHVAIQIARHFGAFVATTVSGLEKAEFVKSLGAELAIDYRSEDFVDEVLHWTNGVGVKTVLDTVGGLAFCKSFGATRVYGSVVTILSTSCDMDWINVARVRNLNICYVQMPAPLYLGLRNGRMHQTRILEEARNLVEAGALKPRIGQVLPLKDAAEAHRILEEGHAVGKIVLEVP